MSQSQSYTGTQAAVRVLRLLKLFDSKQTVWSLPQLVEAGGLNKTTTFRMLTALESEGLIEKTATGNYQLGSATVALGARALGHVDLLSAAHPHLRELTQKVGERSTLEIMVRDEDEYAMLILDELPCHHMIGINNGVGSRVPLETTSTGRALLAFMDNDMRSRIPLRPHGIDFEAIRERGYAVALGELEAGLMACGAPIFNHTGMPIAVISVEAPDIRVDEAALHGMAADLLETAAAISKRLGFNLDSIRNEQ